MRNGSVLAGGRLLCSDHFRRHTAAPSVLLQPRMASPVQGLWLGGAGFASQLATRLPPELQRCSSCGRRGGAMSATVCLAVPTLALVASHRDARALCFAARYGNARRWPANPGASQPCMNPP